MAAFEMDLEQGDLDANLQRRVDDGVLRWEMNDPRDRWRHTGEPPPVTGLEDYGLSEPMSDSGGRPDPTPAQVNVITPSAWRGTELAPQRWIAGNRIPAADLTIYSGNGGAGKTETAVQLLVSVAAGLSDWLGCTVEAGPVLFLSCEEPEENIRDRVERICKHRCVDPHSLENLHLVCPELDATWLAHAGRDGRLAKAPLLDWLETWIGDHRPALVVIDSIAAVFDGDAIARRQVRAFLAMLRKVAREHDTAIVLLDHPSVRGMADGSGTANSVDWRNSVRSMLHLSDPEKDDPDVRILEVKKSNRGRAGEKVTLRWTGLTFTTDMAGIASPHRAAAEREVDELFLRLLDRRNAQGRPVRPHPGRDYAPGEFERMPEAGGVKSKALAAAMERLLDAGTVKVATVGPPSRAARQLERGS